MSPEEAEGSVFDAVVLLHATDEAWPEPARLHPLLGWPLQQELGLPGADPARDADRSMWHAESLLRRTQSVLVLRAAADERGALRSSPLVGRLGIPFAPADSLLPECAPPEPIAEEVAPDDAPLPPLPSPELRGGATVLKHQAACGFLAFAEMRLHSTTVDPCELGLNAIERGNLVHRALESFWSVTQSQAELRALSHEERQRRLGEAIDTAFSRFPAPAPGWNAAYVRIQRERLRRLLLRWLDLELQRGPFTVRKREERTSIPIGPLQLKVQPDRVDDVEGGIVLVDYKTGYKVHPSNWEGERPDDPQLPLYALLSEPGTLQALLFGRIRPGVEMKWQGLASNPTVLPKQRQKLVDLDVRREEWNSVLTTLAENFAAGRADVDPKSFTFNCEGCRQRLLCRVDPVALASAIEESESEEEFDV
jgi:probable DNA repair protein